MDAMINEGLTYVLVQPFDLILDDMSILRLEDTQIQLFDLVLDTMFNLYLVFWLIEQEGVIIK